MKKVNEVPQEILDTFQKLGIEKREDRVKYSFGSSLLDDDNDNEFKTEFILLTPDGMEVLR